MAGYLFSVTGAGYFHRHARDLQSPSESACACGEEPAAGADHGRKGAPSCRVTPAEGPTLEAGTAERGTDHPCPVCHFLGQKLLPPPPVGQVAGSALARRMVHFKPARPFCPPVQLLHCRAPPEVA